MMKKLNKLIKKNKELFVSLFIAFLILAPFQSVKAGIWDDIYNAVKNIITLPYKIGLLLTVIFLIMGFLYFGIVTALIYLVFVYLSTILISYSLDVPVSPAHYSRAEEIQVIVDSWRFTSNFVNMFFVLTLTFIGLATILRIKDYEAKQLLPKLLLIAILINFTPVIIGVIVDLGNLVTAFFINQAGFNINSLDKLLATLSGLFSLNTIGSFIKDLPNLLFGSFATATGESISIIGKILIGQIFVLASAYVYICIAGMFFLRVIMLWILTVISPIAFFSYIIPSNSPLKNLFPGILSWDNWWKEFLQWVVVGIPFGLFFYISNAMFYAANSAERGVFDFSMAESISSGASFLEIDISLLMDPITDMMAYGLGLMMLYKGYKISLNAAPAMAQAMIKNTQKAIKTAAIMAATAGAGAAAGAAGSSLGSFATSAEKLAAKGGFGSNIAGLVGKGARRLQDKATEISIKSKPSLSSIDKQKTSQQLINKAKSTLNKRDRAAYFEEINRRGDWNKLEEEDRKWAGQQMKTMTNQNYLMEEQRKTFRDMYNAGLGDESRELFLALNGEGAEEQIQEKIEELQKQISEDSNLEATIRPKINADPEYIRRLAIQSLRFSNPKLNVENLTKKDINSLAFRMNINEKRLKAVREHFGNNAVKTIMNKVGGINDRYGGEEGYAKLMAEDPDLARFLMISKDGLAYNYKYRNEIPKEIKNKEGDGIDYRRLREAGKKYKKKPKLIDPEKIIMPEGIYLSTEEIDEEVEKVEKERLRRADEEGYEFNREFVNRKLEEQGLKPMTEDAKTWLNENLDRAEAKRRLIEKKKKLRRDASDKIRPREASTRKRIRQERLGERKERLEEKSTLEKLITSPFFGAADKLRTKWLAKRIKKLEARIKKETIKKGSAEDLYAQQILEKNQELEKNIQRLNSLAQEIKNLNRQIQETTDPSETEKILSLKTSLEEAQNSYSNLEEEATKQKKEIKQDIQNLNSRKFPTLDRNDVKKVEYEKKIDDKTRKGIKMIATEAVKLAEIMKQVGSERPEAKNRYLTFKTIKELNNQDKKINIPYETIASMENKEDREEMISAIRSFNEAIENINRRISKIEKLRSQRDTGTMEERKKREEEIDQLILKVREEQNELNQYREKIDEINNKIIK